MRRLTGFAVATALFLLAAAPALAATGPESQIRGRLASAVRKTAAARSLVARATAELHESGGPRFAFYRLEERIEKEGTPKTDTRRFAPGDRTRQLTNEVLTVGNQAWYRAKADRYREATLGPRIVPGFEYELTGLERAVAVGTNLKALGRRRYELTAPSKTVNGPEAGSTPIRLILSLSAGGNLHKLRRIEEDGSHVTVLIAETFTDFGRSFGIAPPPAEAIVEGPAKIVTTQNEFGELLGPSPFGND